MEIGLTETAGKLVAKQDKQCCHDNDEQGAAPTVVPDDGIKQTGEQRNPCTCLCNGHHDAIKEERGRTVQGNEEFLVPLDYLFYHGSYVTLSLSALNQVKGFLGNPSDLAIGDAHLAPLLETAVPYLYL